MTACTCSLHCAFRWREYPRPSVFATDGAFTSGAKFGKTQSQIRSEAMTAFELANGRSLGTVYGISERADRLAESRTYDARKRANVERAK